MKSDKIILSLSLVILLTSISWISSCTHKVDTTSLPRICYQEINTIITSNCTNITGCHDGTPGSESFDMTTDPSVWIPTVIKAYNPDKSPFYLAITSIRGENKMPPNKPPIAKESRSSVRLWIEQGALTKACEDDLPPVIKGKNKLLNE